MKNRVALVTGGGRGIGKAIALALAENGARVAITARTKTELDAVSNEAGGDRMFPIVADLSDAAAPAQIVATVMRELGPVEILVNNAGIGSGQEGEKGDPRSIVDFDDAFWELTLRVNLTAPYVLTRLVLPKMIEHRWGRLINIASINAKIPALHGSAYTASKHALAGFTKVAALEFAEFGITANAICPATTRSRMNDRRLRYDAKRLSVSVADLERGSTPLGRRLEPEEVATLAVYLASDGAGAVNGQIIDVTGGKAMA